MSLFLPETILNEYCLLVFNLGKLKKYSIDTTFVYEMIYWWSFSTFFLEKCLNI